MLRLCSQSMWAHSDLAAVRHADLGLAGFGATDPMTAASPNKTFVLRLHRVAPPAGRAETSHSLQQRSLYPSS